MINRCKVIKCNTITVLNAMYYKFNITQHHNPYMHKLLCSSVNAWTNFMNHMFKALSQVDINNHFITYQLYVHDTENIHLICDVLVLRCDCYDKWFTITKQLM